MDHPSHRDVHPCPCAPDDAALQGPSAERSTQAPSERELAVLAELAREGEAQVAFQGLKRRLDLHPQQLTRTLERLEADGLIQATHAGYALTDQGHASRPHDARGSGCSTERALLQALLPPGIEADTVEDHLAERWFKDLRWYGSAHAPGETTLIWTTEPGTETIRLRIEGGVFTVTTDDCGSLDPSLYAAVNRLVSTLTQLYDADQLDHAAS